MVIGISIFWRVYKYNFWRVLNWSHVVGTFLDYMSIQQTQQVKLVA